MFKSKICVIKKKRTKIFYSKENKSIEKMESEKELAQKLLQTLNKVLKSAQYIKQPRGRPRRVMKVEQGVLPSTVKRRYKTLASRVPKYAFDC
jgi:hypothetical protein